MLSLRSSTPGQRQQLCQERLLWLVKKLTRFRTVNVLSCFSTIRISIMWITDISSILTTCKSFVLSVFEKTWSTITFNYDILTHRSVSLFDLSSSSAMLVSIANTAISAPLSFRAKLAFSKQWSRRFLNFSYCKTTVICSLSPSIGTCTDGLESSLIDLNTLSGSWSSAPKCALLSRVEYSNSYNYWNFTAVMTSQSYVRR